MSSLQNAEPIYVLSISANDQDHASVANVFGHSRWVVVPATDFRAASAELNRYDVSVVVCDCDSTPEHWTEILGSVRAMPRPPAVILASRVADDGLWTKAMEVGAWDVLPKPYRAADVVRSVRYAWEHWRNQGRVRPAAKAMSAAG